MSDQKRQPIEGRKLPIAPADRPQTGRRRYASPTLTEYGRVDDLIDSGIVGAAPSIVPDLS